MENPGQILKKAREEKEFTIDVIAQRLRLDTRLVEAIEQDNFDVFPAAAYVRGYLRSYAKQVDVAQDEIIAAYDQVAADGPTIEPHVTQAQPQASSDDKHIKIVSYSVVAASLLLLALWWNSQQQEVLDERVELTPQGEQAVTTPDTPVVVQDGSELSLSPTENVSEQDESTIIFENTPVTLEHDYGVVYLNETPAEPDNSAAILEQLADVEATQNELAATEMAASSSTLPSVTDQPEDIREAVASSDDIIIEFTGESWTEIRDGSSTSLYSGLAMPGEVVRLSGVMPYKVVIGRVSSATFQYQGQQLDLEPLSRGQVARFVIDETGAHR